MARGKKKHLDFELNLIPFIDLLSTCICFLLLTAVWLHIGTMNVKQAIGGQPQAETEKQPHVWAQVQANGDVVVDLQDSRSSAKFQKRLIKGVDGKPQVSALEEMIKSVKTSEPAVRQALLQPQAGTVYEDMVTVMDSFKKNGLVDIGVTPL